VVFFEVNSLITFLFPFSRLGVKFNDKHPDMCKSVKVLSSCYVSALHMALCQLYTYLISYASRLKCISCLVMIRINVWHILHCFNYTLQMNIYR